MNYYLDFSELSLELKPEFNEEEVKQAVELLNKNLVNEQTSNIKAVLTVNIEDSASRSNLEKMAKKFKLNGEE